MKKRIFLLLSLLTVLVTCVLSVSAAEILPEETTPIIEEPPVMLLAGDCDDDGAVTAFDARLILRASVSLNEIDAEQNRLADMDEDGLITTADARLALRTAVSLEEKKFVPHLLAGVLTDSTCAAEGEAVYLSEDGEVVIVIPKRGHTFVETLTRKATCSKTGSTTYKCSACGLVRTETLQKKEHTPDGEATCVRASKCTVCKAVIEPARGHDFAPATCETPEKCTVCGKTGAAALGHKPERKSVFKAPVCSVCGKTLKFTKAPVADYVNELSSKIKKADCKTYMNKISGECGSRWYTGSGFSKAYSNIVSELKKMGFADPWLDIDGFYVNGNYVRNIVAYIPTADEDNEVILFSAHYDSASVGTGAIDNASGVAALLALAKALKSMDVDFGYQIRFAFLAAEEVGFYGAYRYVNSYSPNSLWRHKYVVNVDMAGHSDAERNWYLCVSTEPLSASYGYRTAVANSTSKAFDKAKGFLGNLGEAKYYSPVTVGESDFIAFRRNGLKGVNISWREKGGGSADYGLTSPRSIHTSYDTLGNFDMDSLYNTARLLAGAVGAMIYN